MKKRNIIFIVLSILVLTGGYFFYRAKLSATKVALINYPNFMETKMIKSNDNRWIDIDAFKPDSLPDLTKYNQLIVFAMGINLPAEEEAKIAAARDAGVSVFIHLSTKPRLDELGNMGGKSFDELTNYIGNGGGENYRNMFNYIRRVIDGKTAFTDSIVPPKNIPSEVIFYKEEKDVFESVEDFEKYAKENNIHTENAPRVILFTSIPGPFNSNREHINSLIEELEQRKINVYPITAMRGRIDYIKKINPNVILYLPHGKLGSGQKILNALKEQNVPVICPVSVFMEYDKWLKNKQGLVGGMLSQSVTMPELDGGIVPFALFAQYKDENGFLLFKAVPNRLKKFGELVENYINLRKLENKDKKIAIVYFKGPGKNALVASNMEVLPSMYNLLLRLKKEGYNLGDLPATYEEFEEDIYQRGPILGTYAVGAFDNFLKTGNPELIETETYNQWCKETLPEELIADVENKYGKAPGSYMAVSKDQKDYIAVARVQYGNVVLLPQPLPALGDNEFQLVHGAKVAPPHTYIAPYLWIQKGFEADAIFHFGTHGSLEFLPGKQIALSSYDWTDPLIGVTPHYYIYTISNVGEGMIAKRRSYAVTQTYLTPPFIEANAMDDKEILHQKIHKYEQAEGALKHEYAMTIKKMVVELNYHKDLDLDSNLSEPYSEEDMMTLSNYIEEIAHETITGGLYTMGVPYSEEKTDETVTMMLVSTLAYNWAETDVQKGLLKREKLENKSFFNRKYAEPAKKYITKIINGQAEPKAVFDKIISDADYQRANLWKEKNQGQKTGGMGGMMMPNKKKTNNDTVATEAEKEELKHLIIKVMPQEEKLDYIKRIESDKEYERVISMLDPQVRRKVKSMSKMVPAMGKALKISQDETVNAIVKLVQKPELRTLALTYINDKNLEKEVEAEKERQNNALIAEATGEKYYKIISANNIELEYADVDEYKNIIDFFTEKGDALVELLLNAQDNENAQILGKFLQNDYANVKKSLQQQINALETCEMLFSQAVFEVEKALNDIPVKKVELHESPEKEFLAILNSLNGGYTSPTSGGDPVSNPTTVPTGRNLFAIDAEKTPSRESWNVALSLANSLLDDYQTKHDGQYPEKISFTLWSSSFIETEGTTVGQILAFLGVEPVWDAFGRVSDVRVIPLEELKRPRIDVVVQTSGQLRDLAASRLFLINRAIAMVSALDEGDEQNFVGKGVNDAEQALIEKGFSPKKARELAKKRVFGGVNGNYGASIMGLVESSDRWDSVEVVANTYINNMGAVYGDEEDWGEFEKGVFEAALLNTQVVVQPRQSNTWGALSLDHVYEFMGGLNLAIRQVTGNDAESYFNDFRNSSNPRVQGLKEAIWVESRTTLFNPRYIKEMTKGGASSAEAFAETFRNTFGWNVMKPSVIEDRLWDELYDVYVEDALDLDLHEFFKRENPYALQEMTAVMLETARKGMWNATDEQIKTMAKLHAELVKDHEAGCSGFVCDNAKLRSFIEQQIDDNLKEDYQKEIKEVREAPTEAGKESVVLKKENKDKVQANQTAPSFLQNKTVWWSLGLVILLLIAVAVVLKKKRK